MEIVRALVVDHGSSMIKLGFAGDGSPRAVFPSVVGRLPPPPYINFGIKDTYVGDEVTLMGALLRHSYPIQRRIVTNWDDMEKIWHHSFYNELHGPPKEYHVVLTEAPLNPKAHRERMTQIMFETFDIPAIYIKTYAALALYASDRTTGVVLASGDSVTHIVPFYEGHAVHHAIRCIHLAGDDLTMYMMKLLTERYVEHSPFSKPFAQHIKEQASFVSMNFESDMQSAESNGGAATKEQRYRLPIGEVIAIGTECFRCPEVLFRPWLIGSEEEGIHKAMFNLISRCDANIRGQLYGNIILSGGSTMFKGLAKRLTMELIDLTNNVVKIEVIASPERIYLAWIGGSMLASHATFPEKCVSKEEYDQVGPSIVHDKFL